METLVLASFGFLMIGYAGMLAFVVSHAPDPSSDHPAVAYLLAGAGLNLGAGASFLVAAAIPGARPFALWVTVTFLVADLVRRLFARRWLKT